MTCLLVHSGDILASIKPEELRMPDSIWYVHAEHSQAAHAAKDVWCLSKA